MSKDSKAIFLDRDGVICVEKSYITAWNQMEVYPFAVKAVKKLRNAGWKVIVITNQSAVAKGLMSEDELNLIHGRLLETIPVDGLYYCPHYPPQSGEKPPYNIECSCRKPNPGMLIKASEELGIKLEESFMIGDRAIDIIAGERAGTKTVLVKTGYGEKELESGIKPDFVFENIIEFVDYLLKSYEKRSAVNK